MLLEGVDSAALTSQILIFAAIILAGYLILVRPAMKRQKEAQKLQASLVEGDRVLTSIGVYGTIKHLGDNQAILEIAPQVEITIAKQIVMRVVSAEEEEFEYED